jgi:dienelactone hydrolase
MLNRANIPPGPAGVKSGRPRPGARGLLRQAGRLYWLRAADGAAVSAADRQPESLAASLLLGLAGLPAGLALARGGRLLRAAVLGLLVVGIADVQTEWFHTYNLRMALTFLCAGGVGWLAGRHLVTFLAPMALAVLLGTLVAPGQQPVTRAHAAAGEPDPNLPLVVHQWMGLTDNERMRARMLAELGYVALAADIYGQGVRPADTAGAAAEAGKYYQDRALFRGRLNAGLETLRRQPGVDAGKLAAVGYCFGGGGVLELARSGADLAGVVSFHGSLDTPLPAEQGAIKAAILVCHGAVDPYVKPEAVTGFVAEMEAVGADYQLIMYAGAVHAFTQVGAGDDPARGAAYDAAADRRSWRHMRDFLEEIFP